MQGGAWCRAIIADVVMLTDRGRQCAALPSTVGFLTGGLSGFHSRGVHLRLCASTALRRVTTLLIKHRACEYVANVTSDSVG